VCSIDVKGVSLDFTGFPELHSSCLLDLINRVKCVNNIQNVGEKFKLYKADEKWKKVDEYFIDHLIKEDGILLDVKNSAQRNGLPAHEVAPNQGKFLSILAEMTNAKRILEFGTLAGYSTIWFARAVGDNGHVVTLEANNKCAEIARENFIKAKVGHIVQLIEGPALESARNLVENKVEPFDLIFIDADKPNNPKYLELAIELIKPGGIIIGDNVVRDGEVCNPDCEDDRVQGVRKFISSMAENPLLSATALQTVGLKGWDGFSIAIVKK
jgi:predicted O-methyltransferase YrrM